MIQNKTECRTGSVSLAAFIECYHEIGCHKICTGADGTPEYCFMCASPARFTDQFPEQFETMPILNAKLFADTMLELQEAAKEAHRRGGIWRK